MTLLEFAVIGYAIGIMTTAPVGPVNILAIQHAAQRGFQQGLLVGLGSVVADTLYAFIAIFGVSAVTQFVEGQFDLIKFIGAVLLLVFGFKVMTSRPHFDQGSNDKRKGVFGDVTAAFLMSLTNPGTILAYVAIVGGLGDWRPQHGDHVGALVMVAGVASGATSWWVLVSGIVSRFSGRINDRWLQRANHIAGIIIVGFGLVIAADLAFDVLS